MASHPFFQPAAPRPRFFNPSIGRWQRMYTSPEAVRRYEAGYRNPAHYTPAAIGEPEQQGALDRLDADRNAAVLLDDASQVQSC